MGSPPEASEAAAGSQPERAARLLIALAGELASPVAVALNLGGY